jgi:hypothetical protein
MSLVLSTEVAFPILNVNLISRVLFALRFLVQAKTPALPAPALLSHLLLTAIVRHFQLQLAR